MSDDRAESSDELRPAESRRAPGGLAFHHVLACVDGSHESECTVPWALTAARAFGARVTLLQCLETRAPTSNLPGPDVLSWELARSQAMRHLEGLRERYAEAGTRDAGAVQIELLLEEGHAASRILAAARERAADLIVLGRHGEHGRRSRAPSGTATEVLERSGAASLLVPCGCPPEAAPAPLRRVLIPLDGSQRAELALGPALRLAAAAGGELVVLHVLPTVELIGPAPASAEDLELAQALRARNRRVATEYLDQLRARLAGASGSLRTLVHEQELYESFTDLPRELDADLVVLCAHGASGSAQRPLGGVARAAIQYSALPLLLVQDLSPRQLEQCAQHRPQETEAPRVGNVHFQQQR